ncbi:glycosyltransferase family 25 protein [Methylomagnum ishizawai]|uniref:glycosyltransferase family 25 protein n=1 Tax=Methylomagnum ishizawai TaxID=1760988 RepID=UPI001C330CE8|nr:glycosyltransferase family 25 protein [Methylomagnum ishizawai]BBL77333.1 lipooligosaccharide biosynthesis protein LpsA [Methylomagnum ishizawai]
MAVFPPVWVVNLDRSPERRACMVEQLEALGLPFEIVPAVDGRRLSGADLAGVYSLERARQRLGRELAAGEIGCALSHLRLLRRMVDENIESALILEDDAVITPALPGLLARRDGLPTDCELLLLYHAGGEYSHWQRKTLAPGWTARRFVRPPYCTVGYLATQAAARKILARAYPLHVPIDHWTGGHEAAGLGLYGIDPVLVRHRYTLDDPAHSTMPEREALRRQLVYPALPTGIRLWIYRARVWGTDQYRRWHPGKII